MRQPDRAYIYICIRHYRKDIQQASNLPYHVASVVVVEEQISDRLLTSGSLAAGSSAMSDKEIMLCHCVPDPAMAAGHGLCAS